MTRRHKRQRHGRHRPTSSPGSPAREAPQPRPESSQPWGTLTLEKTWRCSCGSVLIVGANDPETLDLLARPWRSHRCLPFGWDQAAPRLAATIPAKFRGLCPRCRQVIHKGQPITWHPEGWTCRAC